MSEKMIMPKPGTYFRLGETVYKAFDDGGEHGCNRCVFNVGPGGEHSGCKAPDSLFCSGMYFEDHTHKLQDVELVHKTTSNFYPVMSALIVAAVALVMIFYKLIIR